MYPLFQCRKPSYIYFYEIDPVIEFVWRWKSDFYDPYAEVPVPFRPEAEASDSAGNLLPASPPECLYPPTSYRGTHFRDVNVAWYIGDIYRVQCQFVDWRTNIKLPTPPPNLRDPRSIDCARHRIEKGPPYQGSEFVPFDRIHNSEILGYIGVYLRRTNQLEALFWDELLDS